LPIAAGCLPVLLAATGCSLPKYSIRRPSVRPDSPLP